MIIYLYSMQANDVFVICISSKFSIQKHAYLFLFLKLKSKLKCCQSCFIEEKMRTFDIIQHIVLFCEECVKFPTLKIMFWESCAIQRNQFLPIPHNVIVIVCFSIWLINCLESLTKLNHVLVMNISSVVGFLCDHFDR